MKINITNLQEGEHEFDFTENAANFDLNEIKFKTNVKIHVDLFKNSNQYDLKINIRGIFDFLCDRCLEPYNDRFSRDFEIVYKIDYSGEMNEDDSDEILKFISPKTKFIDLTEDIRDYLMLSVPMRKVPEEVNGVCTFCNKNVNEIFTTSRQESVNPVWEKLLRIKSK